MSIGLLSLLYSDVSYIAKFLLILWIVYALLSLLKSAKPHPSLQSIRFQQGQWILQEGESSEIRFEHLQVLVDTGFFVLLRFSTVQTKRLIVLFYDQVTIDEMRSLQILHTIL